jgi:hypothetical protein
MLKVTFDRERETKNTVRYQEREEEPPVIGTLCVQKFALSIRNRPPAQALGDTTGAGLDDETAGGITVTGHALETRTGF